MRPSARSGVPSSSAALHRCTSSRSSSSSADLRLLQIFLDAFQTAFRDAEIREDQLIFHRLRVARRIHRSGWMRDCFVAKRAHDVNKRVSVLVRGDIDERLRAGASRRDQIGELHRRRHSLARVVHRRQRVEARVGNFRDADRHVAFAARRVFRARHQLKKSGFAA